MAAWWALASAGVAYQTPTIDCPLRQVSSCEPRPMTARHCAPTRSSPVMPTVRPSLAAWATIWSVVWMASGRRIFGTASMASTVSKSFMPIGKLRSLASCSRSAASVAQSVPCIVSVCSMPVSAPVRLSACGYCAPPDDRCADGGRYALVDVTLRVVDIELARRRDQSLVLDHRLEFAGLVVDHHDGRFLVLCAPDREPDLVARLVVLRLRDPPGAFGHAGPFANRQHFVRLVEIGEVEYRDRLGDLRIGIKGGVDPEVLRLRVGLDEQVAPALPLGRLHHLPCMLGVPFGIGADQGH